MASAPADVTSNAAPPKPGFVPLVAVVDFHHHRGPEVERWFGVPEGHDPAAEWDWTLLPFMALSDGAHASTEDFSYFTLIRPATDNAPATSLFGISCTRQMDAAQLIVRPPDVTRSTVQKAVVVIADSPQFFGMLRERLSVVTGAWFAQREFSDTEILRRFQDSLADEKARGQLNEEVDRDQYLGMSLRELVREFRWQTLVLLKCCLLQPKMLFFGSRCERLCMMQFSLISLIPGLLRNLQDCAGPDMNSYEKKLSRPTSLRTSDRNSLLAYMGLPLQIFGQGSLFGPYTPLQQLDLLADFGTKSYIVGSTNSLLLQQRDRYSDILINLDEDTINITSPSLRSALALSHADRRWIDVVTQEVNDTWDDANPQRPKTMGYRGSEEFIRLQFEEYLLSLISSVKYRNYLAQNAGNPKATVAHIDGDPSSDFGNEWIEHWMRTENYRLWNKHTDSHLFDIVDPRHPCAGGLSIDDVQRRIQQQVQDLHLDEKFAVGKEALGRNLAAGREKASILFNKFYADMEALRETQRKRAEESKSEQQSTEKKGHSSEGSKSFSVGARAGAYFGSWTTWADQKRRSGWGRSSGSTDTTSSGWGFSSVRRSRHLSSHTLSQSISSEKIGTPPRSPGTPPRGNEKVRTSDTPRKSSEGEDRVQSPSQQSFSESMLDGVASEDGSGSSAPPSPNKVTSSCRSSPNKLTVSGPSSPNKEEFYGSPSPGSRSPSISNKDRFSAPSTPKRDRVSPPSTPTKVSTPRLSTPHQEAVSGPPSPTKDTASSPSTPVKATVSVPSTPIRDTILIPSSPNKVTISSPPSPADDTTPSSPKDPSSNSSSPAKAMISGTPSLNKVTTSAPPSPTKDAASGSSTPTKAAGSG